MKKKRLLASIVTAAMLFTMVPSYALADDNAVPMIDLVPAAPEKDVEIYVPDTTACTMAEGCTAEVHQDGCPAAEPETQHEETVCTMTADCAAEVHQEGCPAAKPVVDEPETETEQTPEPRTDAVAKIGDTSYTSLDEAVKEAVEGATIELLADCELTEGFNKTLTFTGKGKISIPKQLKTNGEGWMCFGLGDPTRVLTFDGEGVEVEWVSDGTAPWLMLSLTGTLNVTNGASLTFMFDSKTTGARNAIYMNAGAELNVTNGSTFQILGVGTEGTAGQGIQLDQTGKSQINVTGGSTFLIDGTNRGYVNSPNIYVEDSSFTVQNCTSNASNGGRFESIDSQITYKNNKGHGLSAGNVSLKNSVVNCYNNGLFGLTYSGNLEMDGDSTINSVGNAYDGSGAGLRASSSSGSSYVAAGARINILGNEHNGLENYGEFTFEEGAILYASNNDERTTNGGGIYNAGTMILSSDTEVMNNHAKQTGGGICNDGTMIIPEGVKIYNNHADIAGDDIKCDSNGRYPKASITFSEVGSDWTLEDCDHAITGWYKDNEKKRWQGDKQPYYIDEFNQFDEYGLATVTGALALKAAHGRIIDIPDIPDPELPEPRVDKTAIALNTEDQTTVTLSIGAEQGKENVAVLFLLDKSTSQGMRDEAAKMLNELKTKTNTNILYNVVIFSGDATSTGWCNIQDDAALENTLENFVNKETTSGTNMVAGIQCAEEQMKSLPEEYGMTYLVTLSDGISYVWNDENGIKKTVYAAGLHHEGMVEVQPQNGADSWDIMYDYGMSLSDIYGGMNNFLEELPRKMENSINAGYVQNYEGANPNNCIQTYVYDEAKKQEVAATYACAPEFAVYYSAMQYMDLASQFTRSYAFAVPELTESGADNQKSWDNFPWGKELMLFCQMQSSNCGQGAVSNTDAKEIFEDIQDEVLYAIKSGEVTDVIGRDFDLADVNSFVLTVGGTQIQPVHVDGNTVKFGEAKDNVYPYEVEYFPAANGAEEKFIWKINVPVENSKLLQLSYDLKLVNKSEFEGTYTVPTNENATLEYVPTQGDNGTMDFPVPTVSYTVEDPTITVTFKPGAHGDLRGAAAGADISYDDIKKGNGLGADQVVPRVDEDKDWDFTNWLCIEGAEGVKGQTYSAAQIAALPFTQDTIFEAQYEEESGGGGAHHPDAGDDDDDDNDRDDDTEEIIDEEVPLAETPWLNTVDHYAYIVGYPEDYVTGQPTEDESRWPVKPQANISRAEVATIFFRLLTDEARDQFWMTTNNFPDVAPDAWYNNAISTMVNAGIIQGYEDGTFRPNNNITRAEFAAIASRFMSSGYDVEEDLFTDIANHWARENINDAAMAEWINGYPDGTFLPDQAITRAEAVTLVNNVLQRKPDADHMLDSMIKWPDNPESAWYYEAIQEATNSHDYDLFDGAEYETWTALLENRDWAALEKDWMNAHRTGGEVM